MATICLFPPSLLHPFYAPIPGYGYKIDIANERAAGFQGITRKEEGGYRRENSCLALAQFIAVLFSSVRVRFKVRSYIFRFSPYESVFFFSFLIIQPRFVRDRNYFVNFFFFSLFLFAG